MIAQLSVGTYRKAKRVIAEIKTQSHTGLTGNFVDNEFRSFALVLLTFGEIRKHLGITYEVDGSVNRAEGV
jgi:hypothetical protein